MTAVSLAVRSGSAARSSGGAFAGTRLGGICNSHSRPTDTPRPRDQHLAVTMPVDVN